MQRCHAVIREACEVDEPTSQQLRISVGLPPVEVFDRTSHVRERRIMAGPPHVVVADGRAEVVQAMARVLRG